MTLKRSICSGTRKIAPEKEANSILEGIYCMRRSTKWKMNENYIVYKHMSSTKGMRLVSNVELHVYQTQCKWA